MSTKKPLTVEDLESLQLGSKVVDCDGEVWSKVGLRLHYDMWRVEAAGQRGQRREEDSEDISISYGPIFPVEENAVNSDDTISKAEVASEYIRKQELLKFLEQNTDAIWVLKANLKEHFDLKSKKQDLVVTFRIPVEGLDAMGDVWGDAEDWFDNNAVLLSANSLEELIIDHEYVITATVEDRIERPLS